MMSVAEFKVDEQNVLIRALLYEYSIRRLQEPAIRQSLMLQGKPAIDCFQDVLARLYAEDLSVFATAFRKHLLHEVFKWIAREEEVEMNRVRAQPLHALPPTIHDIDRDKPMRVYHDAAVKYRSPSSPPIPLPNYTWPSGELFYSYMRYITPRLVNDGVLHRQSTHWKHMEAIAPEFREQAWFNRIIVYDTNEKGVDTFKSRKSLTKELDQKLEDDAAKQWELCKGSPCRFDDWEYTKFRKCVFRKSPLCAHGQQYFSFVDLYDFYKKLSSKHPIHCAIARMWYHLLYSEDPTKVSATDANGHGKAVVQAVSQALNSHDAKWLVDELRRRVVEGRSE